MPEVVTICITDELIVVKPGKVSKARLAFRAAGLEIYKLGKSAYHHDDCVPNIAMNLCLERHIPVVSLRRVK